jgi:arginine/lysine/ornithine decarboxylase
MTTRPNVLIYSGIDGWRRQIVRDGQRLLGAAIERADRLQHEVEQRPGLHVLHDELLHEQASHDLDRLHILIDVAELDISGYQAADWVRAHRAVDLGLSDHRRAEVTLSTADDDDTVQRLLDALDGMVAAAADFPRPPKVDLPSFDDIEIEPVLLPRDAFFAPREDMPVQEAVGRVAAEQITPYPPGIPAVVPGERITAGIVDYLRSGLTAGMVLPDPADPSLTTIRVTASG